MDTDNEQVCVVLALDRLYAAETERVVTNVSGAAGAAVDRKSWLEGASSRGVEALVSMMGNSLKLSAAQFRVGPTSLT